MTLTVTLILLLSGLIHASWNAMVKATGDRVTMLGVLYGTMGVIALIALPFVPPLAEGAWIYLLPAGIVHVVYKFGIIKMYQHGDLGLVYPVARGIAPVGVMVLALLLADEIPTTIQITGIALVCMGLFGFLGRNAGASFRALGYAILTGLIIASYTVLDGLGVRSTASPFSFAAWIFIIDGFGTLALTLYLRRGAFFTAALPILKIAIPGGAIAGFAYVAVMWALGQGTMGSVSAIRESSIVFAAIIGTLFLGEPMGSRRIIASIIVLIGIVVLNLGL